MLSMLVTTRLCEHVERSSDICDIACDRSDSARCESDHPCRCVVSTCARPLEWWVYAFAESSWIGVFFGI